RTKRSATSRNIPSDRAGPRPGACACKRPVAARRRPVAPSGMRTRLIPPLCLTALALACGEPKKTGPTAEEQAATAKKPEDDAKDAAAVADGKAKREADEKAKADADAKVAAELERLSATLPAKLPKDPVAACDAVGQAQDAFVRRLGDEKAIAAWDAGG